MGLKDILEMDISDKSVLIIGCPASGKTWLSNKLNRTTHKLIHTDNYAALGYEMGMYGALNDAAYSSMPTIVEGVFGYRMLRKGAEYGNYYPSIVIEIKIPEQRMLKTYMRERNPNKIKYLKQFNETHQKILDDYNRIIEDELKPKWVIFNNNY